jgi:hypothetical protein
MEDLHKMLQDLVDLRVSAIRLSREEGEAKARLLELKTMRHAAWQEFHEQRNKLAQKSLAYITGDTTLSAFVFEDMKVDD